MAYGYILIIIPIVLLTAFIVMIAKRMTEGSSLVEAFGMKNAVVEVIILMVGMLVMIPIIDSVDPAYEYDSDSKTFTVYRNITGTEFSWGNATAAESLIVENGVTTISDGAFADFDNLKYISIPEGAEIAEGAFPFDFVDPYGEPSSAAGRFAVYDGSAWLSDPGLYRLINTSEINGFATGVTGVKVAALPPMVNDITITGIADRAFRDNADLVFVTDFPDSEIVRTGINTFTADISLLEARLSALTALGNYAFQDCTMLAGFDGPSVVTIGNYAFKGTAITSVEFPKATSVGYRCFQNCTTLERFIGPSVVTLDGDAFGGCSALASIDLASIKSMGSGALSNTAFTSPYMPELETIGNYAFQGSAIVTIQFPKVTSIGTRSFNNCASIEEVSFGPSLETVASDSFNSWTFYGTDGTTTIDKTVAANLAGKTFQGTAAALIEVTPGLLSLTPQQLQQVQLHNQELQDLKDRLDIDPLPFQPSLQTEQEQVAA